MRHKYYLHGKELFFRHDDDYNSGVIEHRHISMYDIFTELLEEIEDLRSEIKRLEERVDDQRRFEE